MVVLPRLKLQYISDIHSEYRKISFNLEPKAGVLTLNGDIGDPFTNEYKNILDYCSYNFDKVFLLAGNHEYWQKKFTMKDVDEQINTITNRYNNLHYLNNSNYDYKGYLFHGSTLWSKISDANYKQTIWYTDNKQLCMDIQNILCELAIDYLNTNIDKNKKNIVLTHYLPSYDLILDKYKNNPYYENKLERYANKGLDYLFDKEYITCWLSGHSHNKIVTKVNGIYMGINPYINNVYGNRVEIFEDC